MTVNTINEWGKLKEIIVGRVPNKYMIPVVKKKLLSQLMTFLL